MARAKNSTKLTGQAVTTAPKRGAAALIQSDIAESDMGDAAALIRSLTAEREGVEWNVKVYHVPGTMGRGSSDRQQYLFACDLEHLPNLESQLAEQFPGGGIFRVQIRADNQLVKNITLDIAPRPGWKPPPPDYLRPVTPTPAAEGPSTDRMDLFFMRLAEQQEKSAQQTRDLIASLIAAQPKATPAPTLAEQLTIFSQFQAMLPKGVQENGMDLFQKGMDFATKIFDSRGGDGGTSWLDVAKEALSSPLVKDAIVAMAAQQQQQQPQGGPALGYQQQPQAAPAGGLVSSANPVAAQAIDTLIRQAAAGVDPAFIAPQLVEKMPPALLAELEQADDVVAYLIARFPGVAPHAAWFERLVAELFEDEQSAGPSQTMNDPHAGPEGTIKS